MNQEVLIIAYCSTELIAPRGIQANRLINALLDVGVKIHLLTSADSVTTKSKESEFFSKKLESLEIIEKSKYQIILKIIGKVVKVFNFIDPTYIRNAKKKSHEILLTKKIKTVISLSMPVSDHIISVSLKKKFPKIKLITFFSDLIHNNDYMKRYFLDSYFNHKIERSIISYSDHIVVPSLKMKQIVVNLYSNSQKPLDVRNIPHSYIELKNKNGNNMGNSDIIKFRYLGTMYGKRSPWPLIKAITRLDEKLRAKLIIEFIGKMDKKFVNLIEESRHLNIFYQPEVNKIELEKLYINTDILLLIDADINESPFLPSKLIDYISMQKPIFCISPKNGESYRVLKENGHLVFDCKDIEAIKNCMEKIITNSNFIKQLDYNQDIEKYSSVSVANEWIKLISKNGH